MIFSILFEIVFIFRITHDVFFFDLFNKIFNYIFIKLFRYFIIYHYFDNFFFVLLFDANTKSYKKLWIHICEKLNFRINAKKKQSNIVMSFLNIELNSNFMKIKLFANKFERVKKLIYDINNEFFNSINYQKFDEFVNFLFFCAKIIVFENFFWFRFIKFSIRKHDWYILTTTCERINWSRRIKNLKKIKNLIRKNRIKFEM